MLEVTVLVNEFSGGLKVAYFEGREIAIFHDCENYEMMEVSIEEWNAEWAKSHGFQEAVSLNRRHRFVSDLPM